MRKLFLLPLLAFLFAMVIGEAGISHAAGPSGYHLVKTVPISGDEGWDYFFVDSEARRVYVSHGSHVVVMNADTYAIEGDIAETPGVHGIAIARDLGRGFISAGRANTAVIFDLKSLKRLGTVKTDANPDAIIYDRATKRVFTFNGRGQNTTAINAANGAADGAVAGTLALGGKPEFAVSDGQGSIFVNIEDKGELVQFDAQKLTETHRWPLAPCQSPSGLAADLKSRRFFSVCDDKVSVVLNADTGKVVATPEICDGPDAAAFDAATDTFFASCGEGVLTVIHED